MGHSENPKDNPSFWIVQIIVLGFIIRRVNMMLPKSLWGDCWFSMALAQKPLPELFLGAIQDVHPPLYPILSHFFSYNETSLRLLSLLAGVGTIYAVYLLAKELFSEKVALIASLLVAINPYWLQSSNEIRSYALLGFLVTLSTYFYFTGRRLLYTATAVMSIYTEQTAWFWFVAILFFADSEASDANIIVFLLGIPALFLAGTQALFSEHMFDLYRVQEYMNIPMLVKKVAGVFNHFACGYRYSMMSWEQIMVHSREPLFYLHAFFTGAVCCVAFNGLNKIYSNQRVIFFLMWFLFPIVVFGVLYPIRLDARYLSFAAPAFFMLVANGLVEDK